MPILRLLFLDYRYMFKVFSIEHQSQSHIAQCWILKPQKCQNFHVVTQRERQTLAEFQGHEFEVFPPEKAAPRAIFHFLLLCEDTSRVKRSQWTQNNVHIGLPHHRWISLACTQLTKKKEGKGKTNTHIIWCAYFLHMDIICDPH